jgi:NhaP-type Na+/H+ and K+/H+ antiporter
MEMRMEITETSVNGVLRHAELKLDYQSLRAVLLRNTRNSDPYIHSVLEKCDIVSIFVDRSDDPKITVDLCLQKDPAEEQKYVETCNDMKELGS